VALRKKAPHDPTDMHHTWTKGERLKNAREPMLDDRSWSCARTQYRRGRQESQTSDRVTGNSVLGSPSYRSEKYLKTCSKTLNQNNETTNGGRESAQQSVASGERQSCSLGDSGSESHRGTTVKKNGSAQ